MALVSIGLACPNAQAEFRINSSEQREHQLPAVAVDSDGDFIVVWNTVIPGAAQPLQAVFGQRFSDGGVARGGEFRVDSLPGDWGRRPAVAMNGAGRSVVVWEGGARSQPGRRSIWARRFAADGQVENDLKELRVNQRTLEAELDGLPANLAAPPSVVMAEDGGFVVVWSDHGSGVCNRSDVMVRGFAGDGTPLSDELRVNTGAAGSQVQPVVVREADGRHVVVWLDLRAAGAMTEVASVRARRLDRQGAPVGREIAVSSCAAGWLRDPAVAVLGDGGVAVSWLAFCPEEVGGGDDTAVMVRMFDHDGRARTREMVVVTAPQVNDAVVRALPGAGSVVLWSARDGDGESGHRVRARIFDGAGDPRGPELKISPRTTEDKRFVDGVVTGGGTLVAVWQTSRGGGLQGQRLRLAEVPVARPTRTMGPTLAKIVEEQLDILRKRSIAEFRAAAAETIGGMLTEASSALPALAVAAAHDGEAEVRRAAVEAIARVADDPALAAPHIHAALGDRSPRVRAAAVEAVERLGDPRAALLLKDALTDTSPEVRGNAVVALSVLAPDSLGGALSRMYRTERDPVVKGRAAAAIGRTRGMSGARVLCGLLQSSTRPMVRFGAVMGLAWLPEAPDEVLHSLRGAIAHDSSAAVRKAALVALRHVGERASVALGEVLQAAAEDEPEIRAAALRTLAAIATDREEAQRAVAAAFADDHAMVRIAAIAALRSMGLVAVRAARMDLETAANRSDSGFRRQVETALQWLADEDCASEASGLVGHTDRDLATRGKGS